MVVSEEGRHYGATSLSYLNLSDIIEAAWFHQCGVLGNDINYYSDTVPTYLISMKMNKKSFEQYCPAFSNIYQNNNKMESGFPST